MRVMINWLAVGLVVGLGACTTALPPERTQALGPAYNEAVKRNYVQLAASEGEAAVLIPATAYPRKARAAMLGDMVWPDKVAAHPRIPARDRMAAWEVRERLVTALEADARERVPEQAALATASFDCWLRELEGSSRTTGCRETLMAALERAETAVAVAELPDRYQVSFASGGAELDADARVVIGEAARAARLERPAQIDVTGFADSSGSPDLNRQLSERRAQAVADALVGAGVPAGSVEVQGLGATSTTMEPASRRVDIVIVR